MRIILLIYFLIFSSISFSFETKLTSNLKKCPKADTSKTTFKDQVAAWDQCFGTFIFNFDDQFKGNKYEGEFKNGLPDGKGKYSFADGEIYSGEWSKGMPHGLGQYKFRDGRIFEGEYVEGQKTKGKLKFLDGAYYNGFFKNGIYSGQGILIDPKGKVLNEGIWADGKIVNAQKTQFSKNSAKLSKKDRLPNCPSPDETKDTHKERIADWNYCHGVYVAKMEPMKGSVIEADFIKGVPNGFGKFTYPDESAYFEGTFRNGRFEFGLLKFFKESKPSGEIYYGWFFQDVPNGYGEWQFENGNYYEGEFKDGVPHGAGIMFEKLTGKELEGIWQDGKFIRAEKLDKGKQITRSEKKEIMNLDENIQENLNMAKKKCADLGFKESTEKFGFCVLKMSRQ
jgi:hypothetical protein